MWYVVLGDLAVKVVSFFMLKGFKRAAIIITGIMFIVGLFVAFVASSYAILNLLLDVMPNGVGFGLSLLPSSTPAYISSYLTILSAKRLFEWSKMFSRDFYRALAKD